MSVTVLFALLGLFFVACDNMIEKEFIVDDYNALHGKVSSTSIGAVKIGTEITLSATPYAGFTFSGWYQDSTLINSASTYVFEMPKDDLTLKPVFVASKFALTVGIDPEYAVGTISGDASGEYEAGTLLEITATPDLYSKFLGWYQDSTLISSKLKYSVTIYQPMHILARFENLIKGDLPLAVSDPQLGNVTVLSIEERIDYDGTFYVVVKALATPNQNCEFVGWTFQGEDYLSSVFDLDTEIEFTIWGNESGIYIANFDVIHSTITVESVDVYMGSATLTDLIRLDSGEIQVIMTAVPNDVCYLDGWYDEDDRFLSNGTIYTTTTTDLNAKFYAKFKYHTTITVIFDYECGSIVRYGANSSFEELGKNNNTLYSRPFNELYPIANNGYIFMGWYQDEDSTTPIANSYASKYTTYRPLTDIILYAKFVKLYNISVVYDYNEGTVSRTAPPNPHGTLFVVMPTQPFEYGLTFNLFADPKSGYRFVGWFDSEDEASAKLVSQNSILTCRYGSLADNMVYYAKFEALS
jgi:uncharacterized repeat protein (TIGR02543 family)